MTESEYWDLIHAERTRIATMLDDFTDEQWRATSLSTEWTAQEVTAHLAAGANTGLVAWIVSMAMSGFNSNKHNARQMNRYLGDTSKATLEMFRNSVEHTVAPTRDYGAWLGEVIVHGQDIAHPLGIILTPHPIAVEEVARFYASKDFAVNSARLIKGLTVEATDSQFRNGTGPLVRGSTLDLVMTMAGRTSYLDSLEGEGVSALRSRL